MFKKRSKSVDSPRGSAPDFALQLPTGHPVLITQDTGPVESIPPILNHPEIRTKLNTPHQGVLLQNDGENINQFYVDERLNDNAYVELNTENNIRAMLDEFKTDIMKKIDLLSANNSKYTSRKSSTCPTPKVRKDTTMENNTFSDRLTNRLLNLQPHTQQEPTDINIKLQRFSKNRLMIESLPKLELVSRSHFKKYLEDMQLEFHLWNHPKKLYIPICIQRTYPDIKSELLRGYKDKTITNKEELTKAMSKLCLRGESYDVVKTNYILNNKMSENQLEFSNLYNSITNKQVEHLISLDVSLQPEDMRRERTRLALELFKASIHPNVLSHCQSLGKTSTIDDLLAACNNFAQSTVTKTQQINNYSTSKRVFTMQIDDKDRKIAQLEQQLKQYKSGSNNDHTQTKFRCKHCEPNKLNRKDCRHCWRHSDLSKGIIRKDCQQCKYWRNKKAQAEKAHNNISQVNKME